MSAEEFGASIEAYTSPDEFNSGVIHPNRFWGLKIDVSCSKDFTKHFMKLKTIFLRRNTFMSKLVWDKLGERYYETGVDHGVL